MNPTISFCVTVHNEGKELALLVSRVYPWLKNHPEDELVVVDDYSDDPNTVSLLHELERLTDIAVRVIQHRLNGDFSAHKNFASEQCKGDFIFQIDADEYPTHDLLENIKDLINFNPQVELFRLPRVNIVRGLTDEDARRWGWQVFSLTEYPGLPIVNKNDHQGRLYKNVPNRIKWVRPVHEIIFGAEAVATVPFDPSFALIHDKTIDRQRAQNDFYSKNWANK